MNRSDIRMREYLCRRLSAARRGQKYEPGLTQHSGPYMGPYLVGSNQFPYLSEYACQIWSPSDGRVGKGVQTDIQTDKGMPQLSIARFVTILRPPLPTQIMKVLL